MLTPVKEILQIADQANTAVIGFNCIDYNQIYAMVHAAEEVKKPVICMLYPEHTALKNMTSPEIFAEIVKNAAKEVSVPVGLHMDHCQDIDYINRALKAGFSCVMYDGSMLPFEENIANTKKVADTAHALGAAVEAELGHVGLAETVSDQDNCDLYTQPDIAAQFVERSSCDALAVAIGSAHGFYKQTPHLDIKRLTEINAATSIPLVLHGGTGIPDDQLDQAFTHGINKFNVGTEFFKLYLDLHREYYLDKRSDSGIFDFSKYAQDELMKYLTNKLQLSKF
ncbi:MAG: class II fructose-bisphosphate aldolase [Eubacteriales bacterium]|nr:class II fructose-bisphosphate aldolase [Eubacteriales bacterium]